jgi:UDP-N-acetylglucosamine 2-epimerase (non-hydrolysing)
MPDAFIIVLIGTKAQFIKTAPILREFDTRKVEYRLVYTGQHSETFDLLEAAFDTRPADDVMVPAFEASTHSSFLRWTLAFWRAALACIWRGKWRGASLGLVHGDTASTLFAALALRLAGVPVAHVEAGLRSPRLLEPFPEEIVRRIVSRLAEIHFAPDQQAMKNLQRSGGRVINTGGNTLGTDLADWLWRCRWLWHRFPASQRKPCAHRRFRPAHGGDIARCSEHAAEICPASGDPREAPN